MDDWKTVLLDLLGDIDIYSITLLLAFVGGCTAVVVSILVRLKWKGTEHARKVTLISALAGLGFAAFSTFIHYWRDHQLELSWIAFPRTHPSFPVVYLLCLLALLLMPHRSERRF